MGRYYAMDRDKRWVSPSHYCPDNSCDECRYERTKIAFEGLTQGVGEKIALDQLIQVCNASSVP